MTEVVETAMNLNTPRQAAFTTESFASDGQLCTPHLMLNQPLLGHGEPGQEELLVTSSARVYSTYTDITVKSSAREKGTSNFPE